MGVRRKGQGTLPLIDFEIFYFPVTFSAKKFVFLVSREKNEISPLLAPPEKDLSDAHVPNVRRGQHVGDKFSSLLG